MLSEKKRQFDKKKNKKITINKNQLRVEKRNENASIKICLNQQLVCTDLEWK